jgi:hypothetical protein
MYQNSNLVYDNEMINGGIRPREYLQGQQLTPDFMEKTAQERMGIITPKLVFERDPNIKIDPFREFIQKNTLDEDHARHCKTVREGFKNWFTEIMFITDPKELKRLNNLEDFMHDVVYNDKDTVKLFRGVLILVEFFRLVFANNLVASIAAKCRLERTENANLFAEIRRKGRTSLLPTCIDHFIIGEPDLCLDRVYSEHLRFTPFEYDYNPSVVLNQFHEYSSMPLEYQIKSKQHRGPDITSYYNDPYPILHQEEALLTTERVTEKLDDLRDRATNKILYKGGMKTIHPLHEDQDYSFVFNVTPEERENMHAKIKNITQRQPSTGRRMTLTFDQYQDQAIPQQQQAQVQAPPGMYPQIQSQPLRVEQVQPGVRQVVPGTQQEYRKFYKTLRASTRRDDDDNRPPPDGYAFGYAYAAERDYGCGCNGFGFGDCGCGAVDPRTPSELRYGANGFGFGYDHDPYEDDEFDSQYGCGGGGYGYDDDDNDYYY